MADLQKVSKNFVKFDKKLTLFAPFILFLLLLASYFQLMGGARQIHFKKALRAFAAPKTAPMAGLL
jgi:hypothetical protein